MRVGRGGGGGGGGGRPGAKCICAHAKLKTPILMICILKSHHFEHMLLGWKRERCSFFGSAGLPDWTSTKEHREPSENVAVFQVDAL